jgi:hypothetical protein
MVVSHGRKGCGHAWEKLLDEKTGAATTWKIGAICRNEVASGAA